MEAPPRSPGVKFPPPTIPVAGFLVGWVLERWVYRIHLAGGGASRVVALAGAVLVALGLALMAWGLVTLWRARTAIMPHHPASRLVMAGPYRLTRNPIYLGFVLVYGGLAGVLNVAWPLLLLPLVLYLMQRLVIAREERYLVSAFGEGYDAYRRQVRRWI